MLKGIDISHHNFRSMKDKDEINKFDFVIIKATEGSTYRDPKCEEWSKIVKSPTLKGYYHFARPDNKNSAKAEANNFLSVILKYIDGETILALDVEAGALLVKNLDDWCLEWCKYVKSATGITPLIYCSESECRRFKKCADFGCGLWVAKWSPLKPKNITPWHFFAIWQRSDTQIVSGVRCDYNLFNGTSDQYLRYCRN